MRISGGFILGGICGILAANYMMKRKPAMMQWAGSTAASMMTGVKDKVLDTAINRKFGKSETSRHADSSGTDGKTWKTLDKLMETDPQARKAAAEIAGESGQSASH